MKTHQPNPKKFKPVLRLLIPYTVINKEICSTHRPGQILKSADGKTKYEVQLTGALVKV